VGEERSTVKSLELKEKEQEEDNAEAQRMRGGGWVAGTGWRLTNTTHVTTYANTLSSVYWNAIRITCGKMWRSQKTHTQTCMGRHAFKSYFGSFNDKLRGKNEEHCDQYPDDVADRNRQTSER
jgi:hypothetical protein